MKADKNRLKAAPGKNGKTGKGKSSSKKAPPSPVPAPKAGKSAPGKKTPPRADNAKAGKKLRMGAWRIERGNFVYDTNQGKMTYTPEQFFENLPKGERRKVRKELVRLGKRKYVLACL